MSKQDFDQGRSTGEREGMPAWGDPNEAYRVSGGGVAGLLPPDSGTRNQPIRGRGSLGRIPGCHGAQMIAGTDVITSPTNREVQGLVAERMASVMSAPQYAHSQWVQRGMPGKRDFADGTGRSSGKIKAVNQFGLGAAVARPADLGHDPLTDPPTDYFANPEGLDRYVGAKSILRESEYGSGFPREHERSQFPTMGDDLMSMFTGTPRGAR